jgi:hypothetical protein
MNSRNTARKQIAHFSERSEEVSSPLSKVLFRHVSACEVSSQTVRQALPGRGSLPWSWFNRVENSGPCVGFFVSQTTQKRPKLIISISAFSMRTGGDIEAHPLEKNG